MHQKSCSTCKYCIKRDSLFSYSLVCKKYSYPYESHNRMYGSSSGMIYPTIDQDLLKMCDEEDSYEPNLITRIKLCFQSE